MKKKLHKVLWMIVATASIVLLLTGCGALSSPEQSGTIKIELPGVQTKSVLPDISEVARYVLEVTSDDIGYSETIETEEGGMVTLEQLEEARYDIAVEAEDSEGDIIFVGSDHADVYIGEVTYVQIILEHTYGNMDIDVIPPQHDYECTLELEGIAFDENIPIKVINGPGILIERLIGGPGTYTPGTASMKVFSIETSGSNADSLKLWADEFDRPRSASLIIKNLYGDETYRWNLLELVPLHYETDSDNYTQFHFTVETIYEDGLPAELPVNYNEQTDKGVEISGVTQMAAEVREDDSHNTLTIDFGYETGLYGLYNWIAQLADGLYEPKSMSVITYGPGGYQEDEISRRNYYQVFPLRFEQIDGFSTDVKGRFRVVLSFDWAEDSY